jgi:hypothetical protein
MAVSRDLVCKQLWLCSKAGGRSMRLIDTIPGTMTISAAMDAGGGGVGAGSLGAGAERRLLHIAQAPVQVQGPNGHTWRYIHSPSCQSTRSIYLG